MNAILIQKTQIFKKFDLNNCRRCPDTKTDKKGNKENKNREEQMNWKEEMETDKEMDGKR